MRLKPLPGEEPLPDDTPLWRYMSLGALFLLLKNNQVFVPTLRKLQEADPKEMRVRRHSVPALKDPFLHSEPFQKAREWLKKKHLLRTGIDLDRQSSDENYHNPALVDEWIEQLSVRRCAWCWFSPKKQPSHWVESMAMWNLYARGGVAIKTTLDRIVEALRQPDLSEVLLAAEVEYSLQGGPNTAFANPEYAKRPFLFKSASHSYESEVRLVFQVNANAVGPGLKVNVDAKTLLDRGEVIISPFLVPDEADALIRVARELLPESVRFRASSELAPGPNDPTHGMKLADDLRGYYPPFREEPDLPELLREL